MKCAFLSLDKQLILLDTLEKMLRVGLEVWRENQNIVQIDQNQKKC